MKQTPDKEWWTAAEIAAAGLADMPATQQAVDKLTKRQGWRESTLARRRAGRGGGWEYSWKLFPAGAQRQLMADCDVPKQPAPQMDRDAAWVWYEALPEGVKAKARDRLLVLQKVEALVAAGQTKFMAVELVANLDAPSARTIWNWFDLIEGVAAHDRLPYLAPRNRAAPARQIKVHCDPEFMDLIKSDYLRPTAPSFTSVYRRACAVAASRGFETLPERTIRRRFDRDVSRMTVILARKGVDALKRYYPTQTRDKTALQPLEVVNADFHKFDVFVRWPQERGQDKPMVGRAQMVAFQDIYSGRILSWRVDQTPNRIAVALAAGDMIEDWGIPEHVLLDNGREFAAKSLTGGAPTRYRFRVREDDLPGLFVSLGCKIHWATPYSGQSKPIERAFRDMCDGIAKDPRFDGAYTGNTPLAKPEDYMSRAIDLEDFLKVLAEGIEEHNMRRGRRSEVAFGRSFAEVFDEAYATAPIRKATDAQRRLWLLGAEGLRAETRTGLVRFSGNEYWAEWLQQYAGERVIARFDPADLWSGVHVYSAENEYLGHAPCKLKAGFLDMEEARTTARARRDWLNKEKAALAAHKRLKAIELGAELDAVSPTPSATPEAKVVRPVFGGMADRRAVPAPIPTEQEKRVHEAVVADLAARRTATPVVDETARERFRRALQLKQVVDGGGEITRDQERWLSIYQNTPEYRAEHSVWENFGDAIFG